MRPRVFPAEDPVRRVFTPFQYGASMRPRVFPAEDEIIWSLSVRSVTVLQ